MQKNINNKKHIIYRTVHLLVLAEFVILLAMQRMNSTRVLVWFKYGTFVLHTVPSTLYEYYTGDKYMIKNLKNSD